MHAGFSAEPTDLSNQTPSCVQRRYALAALVVLALAFAALLPFARIPLRPAVGFVGMYGAAQAVTDLLTAALLLGQWPARRALPLAMLAFGFLFSAFCAFAHTLRFPGLLGPVDGDADSQLSAWLYLAWHLLFPLFVLAYAATRHRQASPRFVRLGVLGVGLLAVGLMWWGTRHTARLPWLLIGQVYTAAYRMGVAGVVALGLVALAAAAARRPRMLLDQWLCVTMVAWLLAVALASAFNGQRFDLGFYAGRLYGLAASLFLLGVLAAENMALHVRLRATFEQMVDARVKDESNQLLASVLQQLPEGVIIIDRNEQRVMANERAASLAREAEGGDEGDRERAMLHLLGEHTERAAAGESFKDEMLESADGPARRVFSVSGAPVRDASGAVAATVMVLDDVTERSDADRAVRHALDQTRALLENTPLAAIEWGGDMVVRMWSRRAEELFGWPAASIVGQRIDAIPLIHADEAGQVRDLLRQLLHCGHGYLQSRNRALTRDGRVLQCEWYNSVLYAADGSIDTVFSLALDVTEREQAMAQLHDADRRKDVFIATLAHELRNPLAPIANAASLLLTPHAGPERIAWIASMISRQSARMARLLDDLLDVSRISRGKIELRRETTDLAGLVREALQTSMPLIEAAQHRLDIALPESPVWVDVDALRVAQVLSNLINNAAKYTRPGGLIGVRLAVQEGRAVLSVSDNGIGIEADMLPHVFEPFVQSDNARHMAQGGLGIGLSLARGLVELHGGTISVASAGREQGATFTLTLPLASQRELALDQPAAEAAQAMLNKTILVADDNVDAADSLALLLRARGAQVDVAHDGEEALRMFREYPADVAILDLGMPRMGGLEVARELSRCNPRPYLVAVTGRGRQEDRDDSFAAGFDEHLTKPVAPQTLIELLRRVHAVHRAPAGEGRGRR